MVHYREFAPQVEVAAAVATWPSVHKAAVRTGIAAEDEAAPQGDIAAKERLARERMTLPAAVARAVQPEAAAPPAPPADNQPGDQLLSALGQRVQAARIEPVAAATEAAPQTTPRQSTERRHDAAEPTMAGFEEPPAPVREPPPARGQSYGGEPSDPARHYAAREGAALFGGEYRGRERAARPRNRAADRQDRSLDAVFSRLSGARDRLPDPRERARTTPGLGTVFGRLR